MKFVHLVIVNDPLDPLIDPLTLDQVWQGLRLRAESPKLFVPYLDDCAITARAPDRIERALRYGDLTVRDTVTFDPQHSVRVDVPAQPDIPPARLTMTIESPQPEWLQVRFEYDDGKPDAAPDTEEAFYDSYRRSAYQESDIDTIRVIRDLASQGRFDAPLM